MSTTITRGLILLAALILAFDLQFGSAYHLYGYKWDHPPTYCADPDMSTAIHMWIQISGLEDGGVSDTPDIDCVRELLSPGVGGYAALNADPNTGIMNGCVIHINTAWQGLLPWVHEIGHCLGLGHSCEAGQTDCTLLERQAIMAYDGGTGGINADDEAAIQAIYGPPAPPPPPPPRPPPTYRLVAPGVARD